MVAAPALARDVEIEVAGQNATQLSFRPVRKALRGRADFAAATTKSGLANRDVWPEPVPGKIIGITAAGEKYIREPLHDPQHAKVAQRIKNKGDVLEEQRETFESETVLTWLYWMRRAVDSGLAVIVKGELPALAELEPPRKRRKRDENTPRKSFILDEPEESPADRMAEALDRLATNVAQNTAVMQRLLEKLGK